MAFGSFYFSTGTATNMRGEYQWRAWGNNTPVVDKTKEYTKREWERLKLALTRSFYTEEATPFAPQREAVTFAPRRVIVPRGIVSWVRMGTRRPI